MKSLDKKKWELRSKVLSDRNSISEVEWQVKSEQISAHFLESDFYKNAGVVHSFVSINDRNEVNTWKLIAKMLEEGKKVVVPVTDFSDTSLLHTEITSMDNLTPNKWGIFEPPVINKVDPQELDVVIIPMAAADKKGNRLGYGKGFYDRFLSNTNALKVGFIFNDFIFDEIPAENFDIKMDVLISERGLIYMQQ